jgi:hypothetical protein
MGARNSKGEEKRAHEKFWEPIHLTLGQLPYMFYWLPSENTVGKKPPRVVSAGFRYLAELIISVFKVC